MWLQAWSVHRKAAVWDTSSGADLLVDYACDGSFWWVRGACLPVMTVGATNAQPGSGHPMDSPCCFLPVQLHMVLCGGLGNLPGKLSLLWDSQWAGAERRGGLAKSPSWFVLLHNFRWAESCVGSTMFSLVNSFVDEHIVSCYNLAILNGASNGWWGVSVVCRLRVHWI